MTVPTVKQTRLLNFLGSRNQGLAWRRRETEPLLRRGWVTADYDERWRQYSWVTLTTAGLRALADGIDRHGSPDDHDSGMIRTCADCGGRELRVVCRACGSGQHTYRTIRRGET